MKKSTVAVICVIVLFGLLVAPLLLRSPLVASQDELQTTPKITPYPDLKSGPEGTAQSAPQNTPQPTQLTQPTPAASPKPTSQKTDDKLEVAINHAVTYLEQINEPYALLMLNVIYRQFGIQEFKDALQHYDEILSSCSHSLMKLYRRIADHNNTVDETDFKAIIEKVDAITIPALYADQRNPPSNYPTVLIDAKYSGGYMLTHALLATIWLQENNCNISLPDNFIEILYYDTAALTESGLPVTDIALEAAAFLYEAGQGNLVYPDFAENVIATQNPDGGWSLSSGTPSFSNWHPTVLALMILLHVAYPAASYPPMIAPASS
jgi:hypothetical protein